MFSISGPALLGLYTALIAVALALWLALREVALAKAKRRAPPDPEGDPPFPFTPQLAGYLVDGPAAAGAAHVLQRYLRVPGPTLDDEVADALLARHGLILGAATRVRLTLSAVVLFGGLLVAGLVRLVAGLSAGRPVGGLLVLLALVAVLLFSLARHRLLRTPAGDALRDELRHRYRTGRGDTSLAMGLGIVGWRAIASHAELVAQLHLAGYFPNSTSKREPCLGICSVPSFAGCWGCLGGFLGGCGG